MALSAEEKQDRARNRMLERAKQYTTGTYCRKYVAPVFQQMIRAEAGAQPDGLVTVVHDGEITEVFRLVGQCACITCGKVHPWKSGISGRIDTGHFLASRRNSILFEETNVAPQCARCNRFESGAPQAFRLWMWHVRGESEIERLRQLKHTVRKFTHDDLVDMKIEFTRRLTEAIERMKGC